MIEVGDLVRPTDYACRSLNHFSKSDMGIVTEIKAEQLGRRAIVYVLWWLQPKSREECLSEELRVQSAPIAKVWLEKVA